VSTDHLPVRIFEHSHFARRVRELAQDFEMRYVREAIDWRFHHDPSVGTPLQHAPGSYVHVITGFNGVPTFRYLFRRDTSAGDVAITLLSIDLIPVGEQP
jgi:hypothetical protein